MDSPTKPTRRAFLSRTARAGLALAAVSAAGVCALVRTSGYDVEDRRRAHLKALSPWQLAVVDALADRICLAEVAYDAPFAPPTPRECEVAEFIDGYVAAADAAMRRELLAAIGAVEHFFPLLIGSPHRFSALAPEQQDAVLAAMERSPIDLVCGCFGGLKAICMMGYWRDPRTWGVLGYDGPRVNRPEGGWVPLRFKGDGA